MKKENNRYKNNGITLIALVVTIVVLLIIAGVTIATLTGENGIITKAVESREKTMQSNDLEYLKTEAYGELIGYHSSGSSLSQHDYVLEQLGKKSNITVNKNTGIITYNGNDYNIFDILENEEEYNDDEKKAFKSNGLTEVTDSPLLTENDNIRLVLQEGNLQAVIPKGFYYVDGKISTGMVISDCYGDDNNNTKGGNQFVWIPCNQEGTVTYAKHIYDTSTIDDRVSGSVADTGNGLWTTAHYRNYNTWEDTSINPDSVDKYKGFYIGRFEAGPEETADFYSIVDQNTNRATYWQSYFDTDVTDTLGINFSTGDGSTDYSLTYRNKNVTTYKPISKKNTPVWNFINQENARIVASNMYSNSDSSVTSSLIDSYAWDTTTQWISDSGYDVINSVNWGNFFDANFTIENALYARHEYHVDLQDSLTYFPAYYYNYGGTYETTSSKRTETATGSVERNVAKNIYDFAGNVGEWTTEMRQGNTHRYAVYRGGTFITNASVRSACSRNGQEYYNDEEPGMSKGFRVVLYIK